jgi:hypothetical protein
MFFLVVPLPPCLFPALCYPMHLIKFPFYLEVCLQFDFSLLDYQSGCLAMIPSWELVSVQLSQL